VLLGAHKTYPAATEAHTEKFDKATAAAHKHNAKSAYRHIDIRSGVLIFMSRHQNLNKAQMHWFITFPFSLFHHFLYKFSLKIV